MKRNRRYMLGLEPFFEGGWRHKGKRSTQWDVESELVAVSILGDVTIDLTNVRSMPSQLLINAYAIGRDVDVVIPVGTHVTMSGRTNNDHLNNDSSPVSLEAGARSVTVTGHTLLGDVTTRDATAGP
jgi:hypothetical protein